MLVILSPAKTLDVEFMPPIGDTSEIRFPKETQKLTHLLKQFSEVDLARLMAMSSDLAHLNAERFQKWNWPFNKENTLQAVFAYKGEAFTCLDAHHMDGQTLHYSQNALRILSGLYGMLRPMDAIMPYRLEMGTRLRINPRNNLYEFWGDKITNLLIKDLQNTGHTNVVNLASQEYSKVINFKKLPAQTITPVFKDLKNNEYKVLSLYAKQARGWMTKFILENRLTNPEDLKAFDTGGYFFNSHLSNAKDLVFTRDR